MVDGVKEGILKDFEQISNFEYPYAIRSEQLFYAMYDTDEIVNVCAAVVRANETCLAVKLSNFLGALRIEEIRNSLQASGRRNFSYVSSGIHAQHIDETLVLKLLQESAVIRPKLKDHIVLLQTNYFNCFTRVVFQVLNHHRRGSADINVVAEKDFRSDYIAELQMRTMDAEVHLERVVLLVANDLLLRHESVRRRLKKKSKKKVREGEDFLKVARVTPL